MDKYFFKNIIFVAFILFGVNATFASNDGFIIQSLNVDNSIQQEDASTINMETKKFPKIEKEETKIPKESYVITPQQTYPSYNPYAQNNIIQYRIGPYYQTGFNRGFGFNYKGFGYNYKGHGYNYGYSTSNNKPIYVSPPPQPPHTHPNRQNSNPPPHHKPHHK